MNYLTRKKNKFEKNLAVKGALGFFPYQIAAEQKDINEFIAFREIAMTPQFPVYVLEILAPQSFWEKLDVKAVNQELSSQGNLPLNGLYLTQPPKGQTQLGVCLIKDDKAVCGSIDDYPRQAYKFRAIGWLDDDKIISMSDKPFTSAQILELY